MDPNHRQYMFGSGRYTAVASGLNISLPNHTYNIKMWIGNANEGNLCVVF
jgi:hypothetical protein